ncbi:MAG: hypothetical protein IPF73_13660, partial [Betaproteobacteria bacterium]|nr:hypothetical protein [Betaproteobacteria bacterium]
MPSTRDLADRLERRVRGHDLRSRCLVVGGLRAVRPAQVVRVAPVHHRLDEAHGDVRIGAAHAREQPAQEDLARGVQVDLRGLVGGPRDDRDLAVAPLVRRTVGEPASGELRAREFERRALDRTVGGRAHLCDADRVARGERLGPHAVREPARDRGEQHGQPERQHERDA